MTENIGELVAEHPLFSGLPADVAKLVAGCSQNVAIATGQLLLEEGEPARSLYCSVVATWRSRCTSLVACLLSSTGLGPGQAVGWSWMFPPYRWHFDARLSSQSVHIG